jgi:type 1 glutamine amidotransferase
MRMHLATAALAGLLTLSHLTTSALAADETKPAKIRVILIDGQNNHDWRSTTPILRTALLSSDRFTVDVSSNLKGADKPGHVDTVPFPPDLSKYDVLVSNYNGDAWPEEFRKSLDERLKAGQIGLVIVHAANNAFENWPEWNLMIGMGWRGAGFGDRLIVDKDGKEVRVEKGKGPGAGHGARDPFVVKIRDAEHPITKGMPAEWLHAPDELYHGMRGPIKDVHLLATAFSKPTGENEPMIWTVAYGKGRVFHTPMGHDTEGVRCVGFQTVLQRGTEWAATDKVTIPIPANFPTADKVSQVPAVK